MSASLDKAALQGELLRKLEADLATLEDAHRATVAGATHESAKPENDKDTRALEQQYLARGQALRVDELRAGVAEVRAMPTRALAGGAAASLGAVVEVEEEGRASTLWIAPQGGGDRVGGGAVQVVTPRSPLGKALIGKRAGDTVELVVAGKKREIDVLAVA